MEFFSGALALRFVGGVTKYRALANVSVLHSCMDSTFYARASLFPTCTSNSRASKIQSHLWKDDHAVRAGD